MKFKIKLNYFKNIQLKKPKMTFKNKFKNMNHNQFKNQRR